MEVVACISPQLDEALARHPAAPAHNVAGAYLSDEASSWPTPSQPFCNHLAAPSWFSCVAYPAASAALLT